MQRLTLAAAIAATSVSLLTDNAKADRMYAVDSGTDSLYIFDSVAGTAPTVIGPLHPDPARYLSPVTLAVNALGHIYVRNSSPGGDSGLSRIDPTTGLATHIGGDVTGSISFGPGGTLYGTDFLGHLGTVDLSTGIVTSLGGPSLPTMYGLDYNRDDGLLYGITTSAPATEPDLLQIDPATGTVLAVIPLSDPTVGSVPGSIAFERDGTLVMAELAFHLWEIDIATGTMTLRTTTTDGPQGLGLVPCIADFNRDGSLDIFDFLAFQNAFDLGLRRADLDGDGILTLFDFLAFQNEFDAGC